MSTIPDKNHKMIKWIFGITAIEYLIWGIVDPLYSLYVNEIVGSYFLVGVVYAIRSVISLIAVFFFARILKVIPIMQALFFSQMLLSIVSLGFFISGAFNSSVLLMCFAMFNGFVFMLKQSSKQNMLMNEVTGTNASKIMGTNVAFKYSCWSIGMIGGAGLFYLLGDFDLKYMYLMMSGVWIMSLISFIPHVSSFKKIEWNAVRSESMKVIKEDKICLHLFQKMKTFPKALNYSIVLCFFMEMTSKASLLFVPLLAQSLGLPLWKITLLSAFMLFPMVFTFIFSSIADKFNRFNLIILSLTFSLAPLFFLSMTNIAMEIGIASAVISFCLSIMQPAVLGVSGQLAPRAERNTVVQLQLFFSSLGAIAGGMGIGIIAELYNIQMAFLGVAILAFLFLMVAIFMHFRFREHLSNIKKYPKTLFREAFEHTHFHFRRHLG